MLPLFTKTKVLGCKLPAHVSASAFNAETPPSIAFATLVIATGPLAPLIVNVFVSVTKAANLMFPNKQGFVLPAAP